MATFVTPPIVAVESYSPGDGKRRYRFHADPAPDADYFGATNVLGTCVGAAEARTFARGLTAGYELAARRFAAAVAAFDTGGDQ